MTPRQPLGQPSSATLASVFSWRICWCLIPLVLLCAYLTLQHINVLRQMADQNASGLAHNAI